MLNCVIRSDEVTFIREGSGVNERKKLLWHMKSVGQLKCDFNILSLCYRWTLFDRTRHMIILNLIVLHRDVCINTQPNSIKWEHVKYENAGNGIMNKSRTKTISEKKGILDWRMSLNQVMKWTGLMSLNWFNVTEVDWCHWTGWCHCHDCVLSKGHLRIVTHFRLLAFVLD